MFKRRGRCLSHHPTALCLQWWKLHFETQHISSRLQSQTWNRYTMVSRELRCSVAPWNHANAGRFGLVIWDGQSFSYALQSQWRRTHGGNGRLYWRSWNRSCSCCTSTTSWPNSDGSLDGCPTVRKLTLRCTEMYTVTVWVGVTNMVADGMHSFSHCCFCNAFSFLHTMSLQVIEAVPCGCASAFFLCNCAPLRDALNPMKLSWQKWLESCLCSVTTARVPECCFFQGTQAIISWLSLLTKQKSGMQKFLCWPVQALLFMYTQAVTSCLSLLMAQIWRAGIFLLT